jgi:hypothetical protein
LSVALGKLILRKTKLGRTTERARRNELKWHHQMQLAVLVNLSPLPI